MQNKDDLKELAGNISDVCAELFFHTVYDTVFDEHGGDFNMEEFEVVYNIVAEEATEQLIVQLKHRLS
jgi:NADH:ubiquinone oxidoreductase subunit C|tara:strand:+ start:853 stop:1056 length:204 start_codon:yes stop_codon:yes gene_type:complete